MGTFSGFLFISLVKTRKKYCNITGENTIKSNAYVHLVVFCAYNW